MKKVILMPLLLALIGILIFGGCKAAPPTPQEIRLGTVSSQTGMYAAFGEGGGFGLKAAIEDINKQGGIFVKQYNKKLPVKITIVNSESDPVKVGTLAEDLVTRDKVNFLISHNEPPPQHAGTSVIAQRYKIPYVAGIAVMEPWLGMRQEVSPRWEYSWGTGFAVATPAPPGDFRAKPGYTLFDSWTVMLDMFADKTNKRAGVFASDDGDGRAWYGLFPNALKDKGVDILGIDKGLGLFPMGTTDFTSIIKQWKDYNVEILWGNCPSPDFATMWRQAYTMGFRPKIVGAARAGIYYTDVNSWGGDLPNGVGTDMFWEPAIKDSPGIGGTTPQSLFDRWVKATGQPLNFGIAWGYQSVQIMADAIERAGTLDREAVNKALGETDLMTIYHRVKFDENQFSRIPVFFGQWFKTDKPWKWELKIVVSKHDFLPATAQPVFPMPY